MHIYIYIYNTQYTVLPWKGPCHVKARLIDVNGHSQCTPTPNF